MFNIEVIPLNRDTLHLLKTLWNDLNEIHANKSINFKGYYKEMNFEKRIETILKDDLLDLKIDALIDKNINEYIGYCISTINTKLQGEIESIFIKPKYRGIKLGDNNIIFRTSLRLVLSLSETPNFIFG